MTKAAGVYPTTSKFISTAYYIASTGSWDNASDREGATELIKEEEVSYIEEERYWSTTTRYYWDNYKYTFFSYSPSSLKGKVDVSTDGVKISKWNVEADDTKDIEILVADIAIDKTKNESSSGYSGVPTNFRQKLSKLSFNMGISEDAEEETKVTLRGIKIVDICTQGDYSKGGYTDDAWTVVETSRKTETKGVFTVFSGSRELSKTDFFPASKLIIPQSLLQSGDYHPKLIVEYEIQVGTGDVETKTAECYFDINLRQESWVMGMEYTYTIHIGIGQYPIEFDGTVDNWNVVNNGEVNIG